MKKRPLTTARMVWEDAEILKGLFTQIVVLGVDCEPSESRMSLRKAGPTQNDRGNSSRSLNFLNPELPEPYNSNPEL